MSKYFCNTCGYVQTPEKQKTEDACCPHGHDDWLEIGDPIVTKHGEYTQIAQIDDCENIDQRLVLSDGSAVGPNEVSFSPHL